MASPKTINPFIDLPAVSRTNIGEITVPSLDVQQTTFLDSLRSIIEKHYSPQEKLSETQNGVIMALVKNPNNFEYHSAQIKELMTYNNPNNIPLMYKVFILGEAGSWRSPPNGFDDQQNINLLSDYWTNLTVPLAVGDIVEVNIKSRCIEKTYNKTINIDGSLADSNKQNLQSPGEAFKNSTPGLGKGTFIPKNLPPASSELTTSTFDNLYTDPPLKGESCEKNPEKYKKIIDQFSVETNPRYLPIPPASLHPKAPIARYTWCNIFGWDVAMAMGCRIYPHFYSLIDQKIKNIDLKEGQPVNNNYKLDVVGSTIRETNANAQAAWFKVYGAKFGWKILSGLEEAQKFANEGRLVIGSWENINKKEASGGYAGSGHIVVVRPDENPYNPKKGPRLAQAGAVNKNDFYAVSFFSKLTSYIWATPYCANIDDVK